ncbi:hypothetical protein QFC22_004007 [Naganishia vaughanmartiniae]|uniref:Uncharacterized protein n=1 Tax=Naganishia vaughanmartiniae TaxID=1424756 RepID=A0ACC2X2X1_9TREE|nr:hypothetical protein QFC22_004007 [Naganishia vaughanmartiniae]
MDQADSSEGSVKPDYSRFNTPVWPKAHVLSLKPQHTYPYASNQDLVNESSTLCDQHNPLRPSRDNTGRLAGTQGRKDYAHPEDTVERTAAHDRAEQRADEVGQQVEEVLARRYRENPSLGNGKGWSEEEWNRVKQLLLQVKAEGNDQDEALKALLDDPSVVLSIREVKALIKNWRLEYPLRSPYSVTEDEIKNQNWVGKEPPKGDGDANKDADKTKDTASDQPAIKNSPGDKNKENNQENGQDPSTLSQQEHSFYTKFIAEMDAFQGLRNNPAIPSHKQAGIAANEVFRVASTRRRKGDTAEDGEKLNQRKECEEAMEIQIDDQFTPDNWVPRSNHLIRLTGKHPMNAEVDVTEIYDAGLITPTKLHYVRNHGAVPRLSWETHTLEVFSDPPGMLDSLELNMDQIVNDYPSIEIPVTIACDGNRRGEVNLVKRSAGFGWSAGGVSTCLWTGVLVRDILLSLNLAEQPADERWYLNWEGADEPSEGRYATSIPFAYAMDLNNDVMLAYGINGQPLSPDHGYPLRSIIPTYVGGRQVKWVKKMWVSKTENSSHYHIYDNRVLPTFITDGHSMLAKAFRHHPDTACMEQNLNSVICRPAHNEVIPLDGEDEGVKGLDRTIKVGGYAYHGSGHLPQRVELSLDSGKTWKYCFRQLPDNPLRHGHKFWTWLFWECEVSLRELVNCPEIIVRAWDVFKNTQPEEITWNLTGMMNNAWYRVRPELETGADGKTFVRFKHPVGPGVTLDGWMKASEVEMAKEEVSKSGQDDEKQFTLDEIQKHDKPDDAWLIINEKVYDVTSVLNWHPGGQSAIMNYAGKATVDASNDYNAVHDAYANSQRDKLLIGRVSDKGIKALQDDAKRAKKADEAVKKERAAFAMNPFRFVSATLVKKKEMSKDTRLYTFELPKNADGSPGKLGLPVGRHVQVAFHAKNGVVLRPYTPTRPVLAEEDDGTFDILVKAYFPSTSAFKPGGTLSNYLDVMIEGEDIDIKGPTGEITYLGNGKFKINDDEFHFNKLNLVAGGTGLTPHWQLIHAILANPDDHTKVSLIDSNHIFSDILLYDELNQYAKDKSDQFTIWHTLSKKPDDRDWEYSVGHLDKTMMEEHFHKADDGKVGTFL